MGGVKSGAANLYALLLMNFKKISKVVLNLSMADFYRKNLNSTWIGANSHVIWYAILTILSIWIVCAYDLDANR